MSLTLIRRAILSLALIAGIVPAFAQVPPPVPALPDSERRTTYSITGTTCACAVNMALYGDSTDYANWIEVFINGAPITQPGNWTISSPTGPLATIPRPITDAVLTFTNVQTGTVQIVGARRPRRTAQFAENRGVAARDLNQAITDIIAMLREDWDKINDVSGRGVFAPPGETLALLPSAATRKNQGACFDNNGNLINCVAAAGSFIAGANITFTGGNPTTIASTSYLAGSGITFTGSNPVTISTSAATVASLTAGGTTMNGAINIVPGAGTSITGVGQNITIGNDLQVVSILDKGAQCNGVFIGGSGFGGPSNLTINSGSPNLLSTGSAFTSGDVGKSIWVPGAGAAGAGLSTTILTFTDATHVVLSVNASTTVTAVATTNTNPLVYGTDDTAAIQNAMTATPNGGILDIPAGAAVGGQFSGGCLIKKQGAQPFALAVDHPFSIRGHGHLSNLMTDPSIGPLVDDIIVPSGTFDWANTVWENFSIGDYPSFLPPTLLMYTRHGKRGLALVDSVSIGFIGIIVRNMSIGESGNDHSLYLGNPAGSPSQFNLITSNKIWGGIHLDTVEDSHRITYNVLQGSSTFGGLFSFVAGSGKFEFSGNNVTWAGGFKLDGSFAPVVRNNYFEELFATSEANNAMVDFNGGTGTINFPSFTGNIVSAIVSSTATPVRYANVTNGNFGDNTITTSTARTGVTNVTTLSCIAPNLWTTATPHFSAALANTYAGC